MQIDVKLFAVAGDLAGRPSVTLDLPDGAAVGDLRRALVEQIPALASMGARLMVAVNMDYATDDRVLAERDEVACIPPVSGG
jgi:molybdopterin converting factor subunit 1